MARRFRSQIRSASEFHCGATLSKREEGRRQRRESTPAEIALWTLLRRRRLDVKFRRRHVVAGFLTDFFACSLRLAIEVDGGAHDHQREYDDARTAALNSLGITVVRFTNEQVLHDSATVERAIRGQIAVLTAARDERP